MTRKILIMILLVLGNSLLLLSQNCRIGDVIVNPDGSKGVVFWVNDNRTAGWMVAMEDAEINNSSQTCRWGMASYSALVSIPFQQSQSEFRFDLFMNELDGKENTRKIREKAQTISGWPTPYAAGVVDFDKGWYLPSIGQLRILFGNMALIESRMTSNSEFTPLARDKKYWSSTQNGQNSAWTVNGQECYITSNNKSSSYNAVRAVRNFEMTGGFASYHWTPTNDVVADIYVHPDGSTTYTVNVSLGNSCYVEDDQTIMVDQVEDSEFWATACVSYEWEGDTYSSSGNYQKTFTSAAGCEYTVTLHLIITDNPSVTITADEEEICEGESTTLHAEVEQPVFYAPGDILCTDGTIVKAANWPVSGKTAKGVVFYVDGSGQHGWAVSTTAADHLRWSSNQFSKYDVPDLTNYSQWREAVKDLDGHSNTQIIRDYSLTFPNIANNPAPSFPAPYAMDLDNGWYLPAAGQLNVLFGEINTVNASLAIVNGTTISASNDIWSSTEFQTQASTKRVYKLELHSSDGTFSGRICDASKTEYLTVRAVMDF